MSQADILQKRDVDVGKDAAAQISEEIFGNRKDIEPAARAMWDRIRIEKTYGAMESHVRIIMAETSRRVFEAMRRRVEKGEEVRRGTRTELAALDNLINMTVTAGKRFKVEHSPYSQSPEHDVMDEQELALFLGYVKHFENLGTDELIDIVDDTIPFSQMLAEQKGFSVDELPMLDQKNPDYQKNIDSLRDFIMSHDRTDKTQSRKILEFTLWGSIVQSMDAAQREALMESFMKEGPVGVKGAEYMLDMLVGTGKLTYSEAEGLLTDPTTKKWKFAMMDTTQFRARLEKARDDHTQNRDVMEHAVRIGRRALIGNPALHYITFNNLIFGRIAELGVFTAMINAITSITAEWKNPKHKNKALAVTAGLAAAATNKYVAFGLAETAIGIDFIDDGWVRKNILYAPGRTERERIKIERGEKRLKSIVESYPGMESFLETHYHRLYQTAKANKDAGRGFRVSDADMKVEEKDYKTWGAKTENGKKQARKDCGEALKLLGETFGLDTDEKVEKYFQESDIVDSGPPKTSETT